MFNIESFSLCTPVPAAASSAVSSAARWVSSRSSAKPRKRPLPMRSPLLWRHTCVTWSLSPKWLEALLASITERYVVILWTIVRGVEHGMRNGIILGEFEWYLFDLFYFRCSTLSKSSLRWLATTSPSSHVHTAPSSTVVLVYVSCPYLLLVLLKLCSQIGATHCKVSSLLSHAIIDVSSCDVKLLVCTWFPSQTQWPHSWFTL